MLQGSKSTVSLVTLIAGLISGSAHAQSAPTSAAPSGGSETVLQPVVVTGSRVISNAANSPTPLTDVTNTQLMQTTPTSIADALNKLPMFQGGLTQRDTDPGQGSMAGLNTLNLRNFGENRTLVLLDNHRITPANNDGSVDIDTLPLELMSRTDVVTGGASAVYGSDAVTGVVNFILDKHFTGFKANVSGGVSTYGDGASEKIDAAWGTDLFGERGHIEIAVDHFKQDPVMMFAREYGRQIWAQTGNGTAANPYTNTEYATRPNSPFGGLVTCTACSVNGYEFASPGLLTPFLDGTPTGTGNVSSGGNGGYNKYGTALDGLRNDNAFARFSYDLNQDTTFYVQGIAGEKNSNGWWFPVKIGPGSTGAFFKNNPFLSPTVQSQLGNNGMSDSTNEFSIGEMVDAGAGAEAGFRGVNQLLSVTTGLDGVWRDYSWDLYYTHGADRQTQESLYNQNYQNMYAAEDAVVGPKGTIQCYAATQAATAAEYAGCVPLNPFGSGSVSQAALNWIAPTTTVHMTNTMDDVGASLSGPVIDDWAGPIKGALSAEGRSYSLTVDSGASSAKVDCAGLRICSPKQALWAGGVASMRASDHVWELAIEADVPLLKNLPLAKEMDANVAGRFTDYSVSGSVKTWKLGLIDHVNDTVSLRGAESIDIRAPNLYELYEPLTIYQGGFIDLHTNTNGLASAIQGGNPNLVPEVARTYTAGIVLTPTFFPRFTASLDYYQVRLDNAITQINGLSIFTQQLCDNSGGTSIYCSLYVRPHPFSDSSPDNRPTAVYQQYLNSAVAEIRGYDLELNYSFSWHGHWAARVLANYQPVNHKQDYPAAPFQPINVEPNHDILSDTHVTGFLNYAVDRWSFAFQDRWIGKHQKGPFFYTVPDVPSSNYLDANVEKQFSSWGGVLTAYFNVQNVLNHQGAIYSNSAVQGIFYPVSPEDDVMGRYFTLGVRVQL